MSQGCQSVSEYFHEFIWTITKRFVGWSEGDRLIQFLLGLNRPVRKYVFSQHPRSLLDVTSAATAYEYLQMYGSVLSSSHECEEDSPSPNPEFPVPDSQAWDDLHEDNQSEYPLVSQDPLPGSEGGGINNSVVQPAGNCQQSAKGRRGGRFRQRRKHRSRSGSPPSRRGGKETPSLDPEMHRVQKFRHDRQRQFRKAPKDTELTAQKPSEGTEGKIPPPDTPRNSSRSEGKSEVKPDTDPKTATLATVEEGANQEGSADKHPKE